MPSETEMKQARINFTKTELNLVYDLHYVKKCYPRWMANTGVYFAGGNGEYKNFKK